MEGVVLLALAGAGYIINKDNKDSRRIEHNINPQHFENSNTSIYDLNNVKDAQNYESGLVSKQFNQSIEPNSNIVNNVDIKNKELDIPNKEYIRGLDGNMIEKDNFLYNDQGIKIEPFYSGSGPNAINFDDNRTLSSHQGGNQNEFYQGKQEVNLNLPPQMNLGNVFGMSNTGPAMEQDRYIPGMYLTDELPFEQEMVPHIRAESEINREVGEIYAQRNNIDNLRTLSNQKVSFDGKVLAGKEPNDNRGEIGEVYKHLPERYYQQTPDQWLVTNGDIKANTLREAQILPETNRQYLNRQELGQASSVVKYNEKRPMFKKTDKQQLASDTIRNAFGKEIFIDSDHMQSSYKVYPNEREVTQERHYEGNMKPVYNAETRHIQDNIKPTIKETTLNPANQNGFANPVITLPEERLQDSIRTNKKETLLFGHIGNVASAIQQEMSQDLYFRADLNVNKELISQGRSPTTESVKVSNGMDTMNMDIQKIENDYFNHRIQGLDKIYQEIPTEDTCKFTRDKDSLNNDIISNRIEGDLLDPFKHNPYTHSLHSFAY